MLWRMTATGYVLKTPPQPISSAFVQEIVHRVAVLLDTLQEVLRAPDAAEKVIDEQRFAILVGKILLAQAEQMRDSEKRRSLFTINKFSNPEEKMPPQRLNRRKTIALLRSISGESTEEARREEKQPSTAVHKAFVAFQENQGELMGSSSFKIESTDPGEHPADVSWAARMERVHESIREPSPAHAMETFADVDSLQYCLCSMYRLIKSRLKKQAPLTASDVYIFFLGESLRHERNAPVQADSKRSMEFLSQGETKELTLVSTVSCTQVMHAKQFLLLSSENGTLSRHVAGSSAVLALGFPSAHNREASVRLVDASTNVKLSDRSFRMSQGSVTSIGSIVLARATATVVVVTLADGSVVGFEADHPSRTKIEVKLDQMQVVQHTIVRRDQEKLCLGSAKGRLVILSLKPLARVMLVYD